MDSMKADVPTFMLDARRSVEELHAEMRSNTDKIFTHNESTQAFSGV